MLALDKSLTLERQFNPISMEVFSNRLLSITEMMAINIMRASFSAQIKERRDFSVGLFTADGRLLCQGTHVPLQLGSLVGGMRALLARYSFDEIREGDAFICNDVYLAGGTHLPDITIVSPIHKHGELVGFAANIGHHSDIGGSVPGSVSAKAKTVFEEGIRLPIIRLQREGEIDRDLLNLIAQNSRLPEERSLDLQVQIATNSRGGAAVCELIDQMGLEAYKDAIEDTLGYTARRLRKRVEDLADGSHSFTTYLDDDGQGGDQVPVTVTATISGDSLLLDLEGTGPQARGALNVTDSALKATIYYSVKVLLDPDLLPNSGMMDAITIKAPEGTIANPVHPAAVGARSITCQKIAGAVFGALGQFLPDTVRMASCYDVLPSISFSGRRFGSERFYVFGETLGGGGGATAVSDGMSAIHVHVTNTLNMPTEALENEFPLQVDEYGVVENSSGAGRYRGGLGIVRQIRALRDETIFSGRSDNHKRGSAGFAGGLPGGKGRLLRNFGTDACESLVSKVAHIVLNADETMRIETAGGGGFGPPEERTAKALADDIFDGIISIEKASQDYGAEKTEAALKLLPPGMRPRS